MVPGTCCPPSNGCHQLLSGFQAKGHLPPVTSVANDKGDNEMILRAVHKSPGICLAAEENPGKPQLGDRLMKTVRSGIALNRITFLQMRSVESHSTSEREKKGKQEGTELVTVPFPR